MGRTEHHHLRTELGGHTPYPLTLPPLLHYKETDSDSSSCSSPGEFGRQPWGFYLPQPMRVNIKFFDGDLAYLFSRLPETRGIAVQCALYLQYLDRMPKDDSGRCIGTTQDIIEEYLGFWTYDQIKWTRKKLRKLGVLEVDRRGKRIRNDRILELAQRLRTRRPALRDAEKGDRLETA